MKVARSDRANSDAQSADIHRCEALGGGAVAQLAEDVSAPALDPAAGSDGAGVTGA